MAVIGARPPGFLGDLRWGLPRPSLRRAPSRNRGFRLRRTRIRRRQAAGLSLALMVIAAAALKCLGGEIQAQFRWRSDEERERGRQMGVDVSDDDRVYRTDDLASGQNVVFCATGVTDGELLRGVRFFGGGARTHSLVMSRAQGLVSFVDTVHMFDPNQPARVRL